MLTICTWLALAAQPLPEDVRFIGFSADSAEAAWVEVLQSEPLVEQVRVVNARTGETHHAFDARSPEWHAYLSARPFYLGEILNPEGYAFSVVTGEYGSAVWKIASDKLIVSAAPGVALDFEVKAISRMGRPFLVGAHRWPAMDETALTAEVTFYASPDENDLVTLVSYFAVGDETPLAVEAHAMSIKDDNLVQVSSALDFPYAQLR